MALSTSTKKAVHDFLRKKIEKKIGEYTLNGEDSAKPFQYALFTKKGYFVKGFIHGCETGLGSWHESVAKIIATQNFSVAKKLQGKDRLKGKITRNAQKTFDNILSDLESVVRKPNHRREAAEIYRASRTGHVVERKQTVDLYLKRSNGKEIYFEIKGPKPNKNEMRAAKRDLLEIYAIKAQEREKVKIFLGMYYNPYYPNKYERWTCLTFFDEGNDFLIGKDFWDFLGGKGTYKDLIKIYEKVGKEIRPSLDKKIKKISRK